MKGMAIVGGIMGIILPLFAQLFAVIDDSYTFGNIGFLGVISGFIALNAAYKINKNNKVAGIVLIITSLLGYYSVANIYIIPGLFTLVSGLLVLIKNNKSVE